VAGVEGRRGVGREGEGRGGERGKGRGPPRVGLHPHVQNPDKTLNSSNQ